MSDILSRISKLPADKQELFLKELIASYNVDEPVAIVGMGCRFPGANDPDSYWDILRNGKDEISEIPADRWDIDRFYDQNPNVQGKMSIRRGGFLKDWDMFDPEFFGISHREAVHMDPQQRLLFEVACEALINSGIPEKKLTGSNAGVFIGISNNDYSRLYDDDFSEIDAYSGTGNAFSIAANRLSYFFDLRGPSMAIDTACSSSLLAVHLACQSLKNKECDIAIAGGVNLILSPELMITFSKARMMAPDGRCKVFDADADGYVRGEGCGLIILKRKSDAINDGDKIEAVIRGSAVNQDGRSNGLTAPNGPSQVKVVREALKNSSVVPDAVSFIEAHGTGTPLGDLIEFEALNEVFPSNSDKIKRYLGSVKSNFGHLEAAAGIAGLIKTVLCLQNKQIPPNLNLKNINPHIDIDNSSFSIPTSLQQWPETDNTRIAGVSSFGFGGTNAHIVIEQSNEQSGLSRKTSSDDLIFKGKCEWNRKSIKLQSNKKDGVRIKANPEFVDSSFINLGDVQCLSTQPDTHFWNVKLNTHTSQFLSGHRIHGAVMLPGTVFLSMALSAGVALFGENTNIAITDTEFKKAFYLKDDSSYEIQVVLTKEEGVVSFLISSRLSVTEKSKADWILHAAGKINVTIQSIDSYMESENELIIETDFSDIQKRITNEIDVNEFYNNIKSSGFEYGDSFKGVTRLWKGDDEALGKVTIADDVPAELFSTKIHPVLLDASLHLLLAGVSGNIKNDKGKIFFTGVREIKIHNNPGKSVWGYGKLSSCLEDTVSKLEGSVLLFNDEGELLVQVSGVNIRYLDDEPVKQIPSSEHKEVAGQLKLITGTERYDLLVEYLSDIVADVLGLPETETIDPDRQLTELGLDSILVMELRDIVFTDLGIEFPVADLLQGPSITNAANKLIIQLNAASMLTKDQITDDDASDDDDWEVLRI